MTQDLHDLKRLADQFTTDKRKGSHAAREKAVTLALRLYGALRRETDPLWKPSMTDRKNAGLMASRLRRAHVPASRWGEYLLGVFGWFPRVASCAFPPLNVVASQNQIDRFAATIPRSLDVDNAGRLLEGAGFGDVRVGVVLKIAERLAAGEEAGGLSPGRVADAAQWLAQNFGRIGYEED